MPEAGFVVWNISIPIAIGNIAPASLDDASASKQSASEPSLDAHPATGPERIETKECIIQFTWAYVYLSPKISFSAAFSTLFKN